MEDKSFALLRPGSSTNPSTFRADVFFNQLQAREIGSVILTSATVPSTQMLLHKNFTTFPSGTVFVADEQTTGKGTVFAGNPLFSVAVESSLLDLLAMRHVGVLCRPREELMDLTGWLPDVLALS